MSNEQHAQTYQGGEEKKEKSMLKEWTLEHWSAD